MMSKNSINRRDFLSSAAAVGAAGTLGAGALLTSCGGGVATGKEPALVPLRSEAEWVLPASSLPDKAEDGAELKVGLVGCGGQGTGDLVKLVSQAANGVKVVALGDMFMDRIDRCRQELKKTANQEVPDNMCFTGFDAYQKVIDAGVDMVMLVTPPVFRPLHFKAAVAAGKHVFMEKPICVDPVGARSIMATAKQATTQGLCVITGTQRHHQRSYFESYKQIQNGLIGDIVGGQVYWNQSMLWYRTKDKTWTDIEWMIRDWVNWTWLSGDHIVEQHVHNIDVFNWFSGLKPVKATAFGARQRRLTGDQYDMFSVDFTYENGIHLHSMCRQIDGCASNVSEFIRGTKGYWTTGDGCKIVDLKGNVVWSHDWEKEKTEYKQTDAYVLELVNWVNRIRAKKPINQAEETAIASLTAVMGRISAYTGAEVTWDQMMASDMNLLPENLALKNMDMTQYAVAVPGKAKEVKK
ncbi:MAG: Gfo/Idh/MocA family oxidoreductase [Bacteroidales bacterium]|nr:Gfo/Idh/MocA family oxidoreductase [Bacteroidales bacterium]